MKRDKHVCFDIETTGLAADSDRIVSYCLLGENDTVEMCCNCTEEEMLEQLSVDVDSALSGKILVTFNGENWAGGFDIPFLRTRYVINDLVDLYPFKDIKHVDLMPIFQKKFNTATVKDASLEDLSAAQCKELAKKVGFAPCNTKAENINMLNMSPQYLQNDVINEFIMANTETKIVSKYNLKHCYHLLFGGEAGMTGEDVPELWDKGFYMKIAEYNKYDCEMTMRLLGVCLATVPEYDMRYFVL